MSRRYHDELVVGVDYGTEDATAKVVVLELADDGTYMVVDVVEAEADQARLLEAMQAMARSYTELADAARKTGEAMTDLWGRTMSGLQADVAEATAGRAQEQLHDLVAKLQRLARVAHPLAREPDPWPTPRPQATVWSPPDRPRTRRRRGPWTLHWSPA